MVSYYSSTCKNHMSFCGIIHVNHMSLCIVERSGFYLLHAQNFMQFGAEGYKNILRSLEEI